MTEPWFRPSDMLPPLRIKVKVYWAGRLFDALRTLHPRSKKPCWCTLQDGELVYLPPKGRSRTWGEHPDVWRPLDMGAWKHGLPKSIVSQPDVSWRSQPEPPGERYMPDQWWRDATQVTYAEPGQITKEMAEGRLMRAICTGWTVRMDNPRWSSNAAVIARMIELNPDWRERSTETGELVDARQDWRPRLEPNQEDLRDFLVAFGWFAALNPPESRHNRQTTGAFNRVQQVLSARAMDPPVAWVYLGDKFGVSDERARQIYKRGIERVWNVANGRQQIKGVKAVDHIALLKERNRSHAGREGAEKG